MPGMVIMGRGAASTRIDGPSALVFRHATGRAVPDNNQEIGAYLHGFGIDRGLLQKPDISEDWRGAKWP